MIAFQPVYARRMGQNDAAAAPVSDPAKTPAAGTADTAPVVAVTAYTGVRGFIETVAVLGVVSAAAWTGVRVGLNKDSKKIQRIAGWVGGVGSALVGLLYLGSKTGVTRMIALPQVQVVPS